MAAGSDRVVGFVLLCFALSIFAYYTLWVLIMPFVDVDHPLQAFFPAAEYAITVPIVAGIVVASFIVAFVALVMIKSRTSKKRS